VIAQALFQTSVMFRTRDLRKARSNGATAYWGYAGFVNVIKSPRCPNCREMMVLRLIEPENLRTFDHRRRLRHLVSRCRRIADFTYVWTAEGWLYVAAVIDLFSRRVVGWSMSAAMTAQLVTDALMMAIWLATSRAGALASRSDSRMYPPARRSVPGAPRCK